MSVTVRPIPDGSVEIQTGLWAYLNSFTVGGTTYAFYDLYSAEGYCFYDVSNTINQDEEGNLLPPNQITYAQYACTSYTTIEALNAVYVSVPVEEGYEIVSVPSNPGEIM